jgi:hypothetical protein
MYWKHCLRMGNAVRSYKGAADDSPPSSLFAEAMSAHFSAQQVIDMIFFRCPVGTRQQWFRRGGSIWSRRWGIIQPRARCIIFRWRRNPPSWKRDKEQQNNMVLVTIWQPGKDGSTTCHKDDPGAHPGAHKTSSCPCIGHSLNILHVHHPRHRKNHPRDGFFLSMINTKCIYGK